MSGDTPQNSREPNIDVALSTRASQVTLASVDISTSRLDVALSTRASEATSASILTNTNNLDTTLTILSKLIRWNRDISPTWIHGVPVTAPAALTNLVSQTVTAGKTGFFYGFLITAQEANDFIITWTSGGVAKTIRVTFGGKGTVENVDPVAMNEGLSADATTTITIANESAGTAGIIYQARLLYVEL